MGTHDLKRLQASETLLVVIDVQERLLPAMEEGEVALIKTYDSATDGRTRFTIHTAFSDPSSPEGTMPRQSIETRCFAFF